MKKVNKQIHSYLPELSKTLLIIIGNICVHPAIIAKMAAVI